MSLRQEGLHVSECSQGLGEGGIHEHRGSSWGWAVGCMNYAVAPAASVLRDPGAEAELVQGEASRTEN